MKSLEILAIAGTFLFLLVVVGVVMVSQWRIEYTQRMRIEADKEIKATELLIETMKAKGARPGQTTERDESVLAEGSF